MLEIGSIVDGKYKILNKVGQGGMSVVYLAMNERANKQWAIKEVRKDGTKDYEFVKQGLIAETDILKRLNHPHLPSIIDVIDCEDTFLIVMDYIEGRTLDYWLKKEGAQPQERVVEWAKQICDVMGYLHSRKPPIIYRDLKPSNVMLKPDGQIMIIDFGTAREFKEYNSEDTRCLGTQGYAAPEQYGGHGQTDARTDIYNLGATMYHLLTGHNPSLPPYEMYPIRKWNPALSSGLEEIVLKCTQYDPNKRYQSCAELMYALEHYTELDAEYKKKQNRKWKTFIASCSLTVVSLAACVGFRFAESSATRHSYDSYLRVAATAASQDEKVEYYRRVINLDPSRGDAWLDLIDQFVYGEDNGVTDSFTQEEDITMKEILGYKGSGNKSNEDYLEGNEEAYDEFAFQMGLAYFYYYNGDGNKQLSRAWFEIAGDENSTLPESKKTRAECFAKIAGYYANLDSKDKAGDRQITYKDYWDDLVTLTDGDLTAVDNERTALVMYNELVYQIYTNTVNFRQAGVSETELRDQLDKVRERLEEGFFSSDVREDKTKLLSDIESAERQVTTVFSGETTLETGGDVNAGN